MLKFRPNLISAVVGSIVVLAPPLAAQPIANAGTLTCTLAPSEKAQSEVRTEAAISCHFRAIAGTDFDFSGSIRRMAEAQPRGAKVVISWSVVAPTPEISAEDLIGRYRGTLPSNGTNRADRNSGEGTLFSENNRGIELRPLGAEGKATIPDAGLTVLEIEIASTKI